MKIIGITGRSGCGKSSVTKFLAAQGYPCIDADRIARKVLQRGSPCLPVLQERFGSDILDEQGELRRRLLADRAFATPEGTRFLTETTQPEILRQIESRLEQAAASGAPFAFVDGAVIVGTPFEARCDHLLLVTAPYESSVQRICARDGISEESDRRRLDAQLSEETLRAACVWEIRNDSTLTSLLEQADRVLEHLKGGM